MKIPKYIDKLLEQRAKAAETFLECDWKIFNWLEKNGIEVNPDDINTGACSLCEPWGIIESIRDCIKEK